jgi:hypothetical protein
MSLSTAAAIKALLESSVDQWNPLPSDPNVAYVGVPVFRDRAPQGQGEPFITVSEAQSVVPVARGDNGRDDAAMEQCQVDVWQRWYDLGGTGKVIEQPQLATKVIGALHGKKLITAPQRVYRLQVLNAPRLPEQDNNVIHNAITVLVTRKLLS